MPPRVNVTDGELHAGPVSAPVIPLAIIFIGAYLAWFGAHYWGSDVKWPSDPVKDVLQGKGLPAATRTSGVTQAQLLTDVQAATGGGTPPAGTGGTGGGNTGGGGAYTQSALAALWTAHGGDVLTANFAAQVALAESSGDAAITSRNPDGGTNVGLWQLDTPGGVGAGYSVAQLQDPATNARVTIMATGNGRNWAQWSDPVVNALGPGHVYNPVGGGTLA